MTPWPPAALLVLTGVRGIDDFCGFTHLPMESVGIVLALGWALAETAGDFSPTVSTKISVWKFERWMIHAVLVFVCVTTLGTVDLYSCCRQCTGWSQQYFSLVLLGGTLLFLRGYYASNCLKMHNTQPIAR